MTRSRKHANTNLTWVCTVFDIKYNYLAENLNTKLDLDNHVYHLCVV